MTADTLASFFSLSLSFFLPRFSFVFFSLSWVRIRLANFYLEDRRRVASVSVGDDNSNAGDADSITSNSHLLSTIMERDVFFFLPTRCQFPSSTRMLRYDREDRRARRSFTYER